MRVIHTEIDIEAPDAQGRAWRTLLDFPAYPAWNPFIRRIEGEPCLGARLRVEIHPPGGKPMTFSPTVTKLVSGTELRWLGRLVLPGLFDGEHCFILERFLPDRVRFFQREKFRGVLVGLAGGTLDKTERGFEEMNRALKARAELGGP
jgi:hypothetical protein